MGLEISNYAVVNIAGVEIWITETLVNSWIIMGLLILMAVLARIHLKDFKEVTTGIQNVIESIIEMFENFSSDTLSQRTMYIAPWFFTVFAFLLVSALSSVFGMRAPSADWATTFAFAFATFFLMIYMGVRHQKGEYIKSFFEPHFIFFPLNLIGEFAKPVSLSFRLFGNMLSGTIILTLYYALTPFFVQIGIPSLLHAVFDVVFGALQTYIFVIISLNYIRSATD